MTDALLLQVQGWLEKIPHASLLNGEDRLERYRTLLEQIKWKFPSGNGIDSFPGYRELSQHRWLSGLMKVAPTLCPWIGARNILLFVDDYSTPRVSRSMQRALNRLFFQRSPYFLTKLATEAATTFVSDDSSGKHLEDGDDYQLVDMGEESLFLPESERVAFLNEIFERRLEADARIPRGDYSLSGLLGTLGLSKTEFARRLREPASANSGSDGPVSATSQRRGRSHGQGFVFGS